MQNTRRTKKQQNRQNNSNIKYMKRARLGDPNLDLRPSYKGQVLASIIVPEIAIPLSTTLTTGVIAQAIPIDPVTTVTDWATRFGALYEEYRIVKAKTVINFFSSTNPGQVNFWWDEVSNVTPTAVAAEERAIRTLAAGSNQSRHIVTWTPHDIKDLQYQPTATSVNPVYFKVYTDVNYGSSAVVTGYLTVQVWVTIQFRGFKTT